MYLILSICVSREKHSIRWVRPHPASQLQDTPLATSSPSAACSTCCLVRRLRRGMLGRLARSPWARRVGFLAWTGGALACGYGTRKADDEQRARTLPSGFRACCESSIQLTPVQEALKPKLVEIVGAANVSFAVDQKGARLGAGEAYALVKPATLQQAVDALQAAAASSSTSHSSSNEVHA